MENNAEVKRLNESYQLSTQNLGLFQAQSLRELKNEMAARNAGAISKLESQAEEIYSEQCQVMTAEQMAQVQRMENLEAEAGADAQVNVSHERLVAEMRHEHHAILSATEAKHAVVLQE